MSNGAFDLRRLFDSNTRVTTLRELEKQGKSRVKVVNTTQIIELITQAVDTVVERRAITLAELERENIITDSNDEFRRLVREREEERRTTQSQKELAERYRTEIDETRRDATRYRLELEEVRADLEREKRRSLELDEVKRSLQRSESELEDVRLECVRHQRRIISLEEESQVRMKSIERELSEERSRRQKAEGALSETASRDDRSDELEARLRELEKALATRDEEVGRLKARHQHLETESRTAVDRYENKICTYEEKIEALLRELAEARERDRSQSGAFLSMVSDLQGLKSALAEARQRPSAEEVALSQASMGEKLQDFFSKRMEAIEQSLSQKLSGFQPGAVAPGEVVEPELVLERLFGDHYSPMESNLGNVEVKESRSGDIAHQIARLKSMQAGAPGGNPPSTEGEEQGR